MLDVYDPPAEHSRMFFPDSGRNAQGLGSAVSADGKMIPKADSFQAKTNSVVELIQELACRSVSLQEEKEFAWLFDCFQGYNVDTSCIHCKALVALRHWVCYNKTFTEDFVRFVLNLALPSLERQPETAYLLSIFASGFYYFNRNYEIAERLMTSVLYAVVDVDQDHTVPIRPKINIRMLALFIMKCYVKLGGRNDMFSPLRTAFDSISRHSKENQSESNIGIGLSQKGSNTGVSQMREDSKEEAEEAVATGHQASAAKLSRAVPAVECCVWDCEEHLRGKYLEERGTTTLEMVLVPSNHPLEGDESIPWFLKEAQLTQRLKASGVRCEIVGMVVDHSVLRIHLNFWDLLE